MKRIISTVFLITISLFLIASVSLNAATTEEEQHPSTKRVAVLYFEDDSNFDSSTGCGCMPNFIGNIFSTKKKWDLESGFATMLNRKLAETVVYQPVSENELLDAMAQMTLSRHKLKKLDKAQRATLAEHLNADVIVMGEIKKFNQHRMKANYSRTMAESGREAQHVPTTASYKAGFAAGGYRNRVHIKLNMKFYEATGNEITTIPITASRIHSLAGTNISGIEATVSESGTNLRFGQTSEKHGKIIHPIVKPTELNKIKFASPEYDRTLFGMVTDKALINVVLALRDNYGPNFITPWETQETDEEKQKKLIEEASKRPIKITYVDNENPDMIYINAGSARGLAIGEQFTVYTRGEAIRDIDTGDILDYKPEKIAIVTVVEIRTDRLSTVKIVEKSADISRGDVLKPISIDKATEEQSKNGGDE